MATRNSDDVLKVLLLGHLFVCNLKSFIWQYMPELNFNLKLDAKEVMIQFSGKSGASVVSLRACQLSDIDDFEPHLVILDIGTNDLAHPTIDPEQLASAMVQLINTLITDYHVQHVVVLQILHRFRSLRPNRRRINIPKFNSDVNACNKLLSEKLSRLRGAQFWWHKGLWGENQRNIIDADGVHFSKPRGQRKYFYKLRAIVVSYLKSRS